MQGFRFGSCHQFLLCLIASFNTNHADTASSSDLLPALAWLREHSNLSVWYDPNPPATLLDGRLTRGMCQNRILPDSFVFDQTDWYTYGEKQGEWLQRYSGLNQKPICWGEGAAADQWFDSMLAGEGCDRPWMVMSDEDVPKSSFQQYTQEAPAVMGLDPLILEFCRNLTHDSRSVPHVSDPFWKTWKAAGMPAPEKSLGPINILEHNLLHACSSANRNILRVSTMAQAKTSWDMCANVEWVVCAAKGKLPNQGKTIEFAVPPGNLDGNLLPTYREYRSNILRWSAQYEMDIMAWTYYVNEICFLSELCDNVDELWTLKRGEPWICKHSQAGEQRLKDSLKNAHDGVSPNAVGPRMLTGGHVGGGHIGGGHVSIISTTTMMTTTTTRITTTTVTTTTMQNITASVVTKVVGTLRVEIDVQTGITQEVLEEMFRRGIANALEVSIEGVVKLIVFEVGQDSGSRRLQSIEAKQYEVSYEVIPPSSMHADAVVDKANRIPEQSTLESQVFQQVLIAQDGVSKVHKVVPQVIAYAIAGGITTTMTAEQKEAENSGMSAGMIVLLVFIGVFFFWMALLGIVIVVRRRLPAAGLNAVPRNKALHDDLEVGPYAVVVREPSHTLLDGDAFEPGKQRAAAAGNHQSAKEARAAEIGQIVAYSSAGV